MKKPKRDLAWFEVNWERPFELEDVYALLSHIGSLTPRGYMVFEVRSQDGQVNHKVGIAPEYSGKLREVFVSHGSILVRIFGLQRLFDIFLLTRSIKATLVYKKHIRWIFSPRRFA